MCSLYDYWGFRSLRMTVVYQGLSRSGELALTEDTLYYQITCFDCWFRDCGGRGTVGRARGVCRAFLLGGGRELALGMVWGLVFSSSAFFCLTCFCPPPNHAGGSQLPTALCPHSLSLPPGSLRRAHRRLPPAFPQTAPPHGSCGA